MIKRVAILAVATALFSAACSDDATSPSTDPNDRVFAAELLPSNEVPLVTNAEQTGSGVVNVTVHITRDAAGTITAANADFRVTLSGFPAGTSLQAAHIHNGRAGVAAPTINNLGLTLGDFVLTDGSINFERKGIAFNSLDHVQNMLNDPSGFYFNVHSANNTPGVARGQLILLQ